MDIIQQVTNDLLGSDHLDVGLLESVLGQSMSPAVDFADLFLQASVEESWLLDEGIVKQADFDMERGFGLRVISGSQTGFAYADDISKIALNNAVSSARSIVQSGQTGGIALLNPTAPKALYASSNPLTSLSDQRKVTLLQRIDAVARAKDPRVKQVTAHLSASYDNVLVLNSDGVLAADIRPLVSCSVRVVVEHNGQREVGNAGGGSRTDYQFFMDDDVAMQYVEKAVRQACTNLEAIPAPAGMMPVVLAPGWPAVLLHEAVGHGLEADFNRKGSSAFSHRMGDMVASPLCTIVDDGTIVDRRGSLTIDDEGTSSQCTVLIEKGRLKGYMYDRLNARLMGKKSTGNGRRESYASLVLPRMTNTYMLPGESEPDEILASVKRGIYAVDFSGGEVDITSGKFVFSASEAYLIEDGKVTHPVKGATLIGNGPEVLHKVSMVGNDLDFDKGQGMCGKDGQSVEVGVGQPTLKVDGMTVGGQQE
ncbi:MAG: metalloprotease TldD [Coxiellaceae bacterium]|nr:metalloprotease TldD [Coxiellaceae bacterium]|tara:strand:- start:185 stop:1624 length:1440 start_codon:yes stop_codon:yes gene_type:complete